jgi:N-acetylmuramoyl-L-alanine amidase
MGFRASDYLKKLLSGHILLIAIMFFTAQPLRSGDEKSVKIVRWNSREYVSLFDFISTMDVDNSFDIITQRGKIYRKSTVAVYQSGFPVALVNGRLEKSDYPVARKNGEVLMPSSMFIPVARALFPEMNIVVRGDSLAFVKTGAPAIPDEKTEADKTAPQLKERIAFIIIDAGHGGRDPGAIGHGVREKDITLGVARHLADYLKGKLDGVTFRFTRSSDRFVELSRRTEIANRLLAKNKNGIFLSIHVNASLSPRISGFETYFLSQNPTNEEARSTATIENNVVVMEHASSRKKYDDVEYLEALMLTTQIQKESSMLAGEIQGKLNDEVSEYKSRGVKKADFYVLRGALMPAVLVEIGYISNAKEARDLRKTSYQKKIARGIGNGVIRFVGKYNRMLKVTLEKKGGD